MVVVVVDGASVRALHSAALASRHRSVPCAACVSGAHRVRHASTVPISPAIHFCPRLSWFVQFGLVFTNPLLVPPPLFLLPRLCSSYPPAALYVAAVQRECGLYDDALGACLGGSGGWCGLGGWEGWEGWDVK